MSHPQRILIVRLSAIGDVIHTLPALEMLRKAWPDAFIGWIVEDFAAAYLEGNPAIDALHVIPKKRWRGDFWKHLGPEIRPFIKELRSKNYDTAIDFQGLTKSGIFARLSGAPQRIGFGDRQGAELNKFFTNKKIIPPKNARHVIERNLSLLRDLGTDDLNDLRPPRPRIAFTSAELQEARKILGDEPVIGLNVGAGWPTKQWPIEHWASLACQLHRDGRQSLLLWGNEPEKRIAQEVLVSANLPDQALRLSPPTSLRLCGALISQLQGYVGLDTGATHLAAAIGVPVAAIYGASDAIRNGPYWPNSVALQSNATPCVPCWKRQCVYSTPMKCMTDVTPEMTLEALNSVLARQENKQLKVDHA